MGGGGGGGGGASAATEMNDKSIYDTVAIADDDASSVAAAPSMMTSEYGAMSAVVANAPMAADEESSGDGEEVGKFGEYGSIADVVKDDGGVVYESSFPTEGSVVYEALE